eukprot:CAMPEP_0170169630 /NCGR_PEP_ID=MMETSP0040_2-20121228/2548_1 /TAXON_ID=641309 /ORGANISM="Lotharella oceanica, Strain CCMP622" /LENGTH=459 /DNA_ID=CAMNT_0010408477 /DNA_START=64 /DNA_END=1443 /DNA_ORIENTATION=-
MSNLSSFGNVDLNQAEKPPRFAFESKLDIPPDFPGLDEGGYPLQRDFSNISGSMPLRTREVSTYSDVQVGTPTSAGDLHSSLIFSAKDREWSWMSGNGIPAGSPLCENRGQIPEHLRDKKDLEAERKRREKQLQKLKNGTPRLHSLYDEDNRASQNSKPADMVVGFLNDDPPAQASSVVPRVNMSPRLPQLSQNPGADVPQSPALEQNPGISQYQMENGAFPQHPLAASAAPVAVEEKHLNKDAQEDQLAALAAKVSPELFSQIVKLQSLQIPEGGKIDDPNGGFGLTRDCAVFDEHELGFLREHQELYYQMKKLESLQIPDSSETPKTNVNYKATLARKLKAEPARVTRAPPQAVGSGSLGLDEAQLRYLKANGHNLNVNVPSGSQPKMQVKVGPGRDAKHEVHGRKLQVGVNGRQVQVHNGLSVPAQKGQSAPVHRGSSISNAHQQGTNGQNECSIQ